MKKVVSLLLALAIAGSMSTMAFAANAFSVSKSTVPTYGGDAVSNSLNFDSNSNPIGTKGAGDSCAPGADLYATMPVGDDHAIFKVTPGSHGEVASMASAGSTSAIGLTKSEMSKAKITLRTRISKGSACIDTIELVYDADKYADKVAVIHVGLVDPFVSINTDGVDFEATAYVSVDGTSWLDYAPLDISGTLVNDFSDEEVDKDTTIFDMYNGTIMKPAELVKKIEFNLSDDDNISAFGRALKGVKYYGVATADTRGTDDDVITKYNLDGVYHIDQINMTSVVDYVTLGDTDASQYIYDKDMKFLGHGGANSKLPLTDTYYLSAKELDTDTTDAEPTDEESSDDDTTAPNPGTGADDNYPTNVNDNPGTGR